MKHIKENKILTFVLATVCALVIGSTFYTLGVVFAGNTKTESDSTYVLNGKTYSESNPYIILEIVPDEGLAELGYLVGGDTFSTNLPITSNDLAQVKKRATPAEYNTLLSTWKDCIVQISIASLDAVNENGTINGFEDRNLFANAIFGNSDMSDKIKVVVATSDMVTEAQIGDADFVYVHAKEHNPQFASAYSQMVTLVKKYNVRKLEKIYTAIPDGIGLGTGDGANFRNNNNKYNLSVKAALKLYLACAADGKPLICDRSDIMKGPISDGDNYSKAATLLFGIDMDYSVAQFASNYSRDETIPTILKGSEGTINTSNFKLTLSDNSSILPWSWGMFRYSSVLNPSQTDYPYFNTNMSTYVNDNLMSFNGDNFMDMNFLNGEQNINDVTYPYNGATYTQTDFGQAKNLYQQTSSSLTNANMVRYIMGVKPAESDPSTVIKVLEIEPSGVTNDGTTYDTTEGKKKILQYFGYQTKDVVAENYVDVRIVSSTAFDGIAEDLEENYDLIIVGISNPSTYINTNYNDDDMDGKIYTSIGDEITIQNIGRIARLSGNDLTNKAYTRIVDFAKNGKALLLAKAIYQGNTTKVDSRANIYRLNSITIKQEVAKAGKPITNILNEPAAGEAYQALSLCGRATVSVDTRNKNGEYLKTSYNGDMVANEISRSSIASLPFSGTIGNQAGKTYDAKIYVDKNGDGIFSEVSEGEGNEVYYDSQSSIAPDEPIVTGANGRFELELQLPSGLSGYMRWKMVVTDANGYKSEDVDGFVIKYLAPVSVKVLQILPDNYSDVHLVLNSSDNAVSEIDRKNRNTEAYYSARKFEELFQATEGVTGLSLDVTVMTTTEYKRLFARKPYTKGQYEVNNQLKSYSMVVLGFSESFGGDDLENENGALDNLCDYVEKGNAILFTHDNLVYTAYSDGNNTNPWIGTGIANTSKMYNMTLALRNMVGLDRYHATANTGLDPGRQGYSALTLMKYNAGTGYKQYSGFSSTKTDLKATNTVKLLNKGQITSYPYDIGDSLNVAETHGQWLQTDLEGNADQSDDIVVWYTLASSSGYGTSSYYDYTGQDAFNNYYIYSKANVTYSGSGHSVVNGDEEMKLFVNTIIKAILSGNSAPVITVDDATAAGGNEYIKSFRAGGADNITMTFTARDLDMSVGNAFKSGQLYWDVDGDKTYSVGDVILKTYDNVTELRNAVSETIDISSYFAVQNTSGVTLKTFYDSNQLKFGIIATDSEDVVGTSTVQIVCRMLFNLN